jgi:hypothetical protein
MPMNEEISPVTTDPCLGPAMSIDCLAQKLIDIPAPERIFRGIIMPSLGCFFGPSKSGKTTMAENLAFSIAAGRDEFLGEPISCDNKRVLIISLEEYYRSRTIRNKRQMDGFTQMYHLDHGWQDNVFVLDDSFPRYLLTDEHWKALEKEIERVGPGLVILDSLSRLTVDSIEDSSVATKLMKRLREITHKHGIALVLIHHSQKMDNKPVTISSLAGSRIVGQELDFMIGINRTTENIRYLKSVAFRYWPDDSEFVTKFNINFNQVIEYSGEAYESDILSSAASTNAVYDSDIVVQKHIQELTEGDHSVLIKTAELYERLVHSGLMARPTLHASLKRLENINIIEKPEKGCYRMKQPS